LVKLQEEVMSQMNPPLRLLAAFQEEFKKEPKQIIKVDGRELWVAAELDGGKDYTVILPDMHCRIRFDRSSAKRQRSLSNRPLPTWAKYMAGALGILERSGLNIQGAQIVMSGDEPAGPRYEYALGMAFIALWHEVNEKIYITQNLLDIMEEVKRDYIGES
jgi:galactokinase